MPISDTNSSIVPFPAAASLPALPRIDDSSKPMRERVGGYLESNCLHCHRPAGGGRGDFDLRHDSFLEGRCNKTPVSGVYDDSSIRLVQPGVPDQSMIVRRMEETKLPYKMHPYRQDVDVAGAALIRKWVQMEAAKDCAAALWLGSARLARECEGLPWASPEPGKWGPRSAWRPRRHRERKWLPSSQVRRR